MPERRVTLPDGAGLKRQGGALELVVITTKSKRLRDYANENSCLIYGPDAPTTISYNSPATPDVLDIALTKDLISPVHVTTCSALGSDHFTFLIDTRCRSNLLNHPDRFDLRRTGSVKVQASLKTYCCLRRNYETGLKSTRV